MAREEISKKEFDARFSTDSDKPREASNPAQIAGNKFPEPIFKVSSDNSVPAHPDPGRVMTAEERQRNSRFYAPFNDPTDHLANAKKQFIEIYHIPTKRNIFFKLFLTDFQDVFTAEYQKESVFGRMDPIATYKRTGRVITLSWDMPSSGLDEAKENMAKANSLIQMLYPVYDNSTAGTGGATTMKSGPIFRIKLGNLIIKPGRGRNGMDGPASEMGLSGIIEGFTYLPRLEYGVFDPKTSSLASNSGRQYAGEIYPKVLSAQVTFTVLHDTPLGWEMDGQGNAKLRDQSGGASKNRFPYGGDNTPIATNAGIRKSPKVRQADWRSFLDLQSQLAKRKIQVRAGKLLQPVRDGVKFFGGTEP
tara:strand:+ start:3595 stop:4680 length:1086 start_codon:yes stop_codon:yes gene_type:complete